MKKVLSILLLFISFSTSVSAYDFMVDGLCYDINRDSISVSVTYERYSRNNYKNLRSEIVIPERIEHNGKTYTVTSIDYGAFGGCTGLTSVIMPNTVDFIGYQAFYGCTGLTSVEIPNSVKTIGIRAFAGCTGLTSVTIPNTVTEIGSSAFSGCISLTSVKIPNSFTSIGGDAFSGTAWFNNQPDGLIYIGNVAYKYKGEMPDGTSIVLKDGCTRITDFAFDGCTGLTSVTIPNSVTEIGWSAFDGCTGLTSVTIPNTITKIYSYAFQGCTALSSVEIPDSLTTISSSVFSGCSSLTSVEIPNSVTEIGSSAFSGCTGLTSVTIPNTVTWIDREAFEGCTGLTSVTIPNSVKTIGTRAFAGCTGLESIVSEIREPQLVVVGEKGNSDAAATVYKGVDLSHCVLSVPQGTKDLYDNTFPWYAFERISEHGDCVPLDNQISDEQKIYSYYENQHYNSVIQLGEQLLQNPGFASNPDNIDVIIELADSYYYMNRYSKAMDCYEKAINIYSSSIDKNRLKIAGMHKKIGLYYFNMQEYDKAIEHFISALSMCENDEYYIVPYMQEMIGKCYLFKNNFDKAKEYYIKAINSYEKDSDYSAICRCHLAIEQFNEAEDCFFELKIRDDIVLTISISEIKPLIQKRYDYYCVHKRYDDAIYLCTKAIDFYQLLSNSDEFVLSYYSEIVDLYEKVGRCYYAKNDIDSALNNYQQALQTGFYQRLQSQLNEDIALCYISQGDYATAYSYIKESVELRQERTLEYFGANTTAERAEYWGNQSHLFQNTYPAVAFEVYNPEDTTGQREMLCDLYDKSALFAKGLLLTSENEFKNIILDSPNENVKRMFSKLQEINIKLKELKEQPSPGQNDIVLQLEQEAQTIEKELMVISKEYRDFRDKLKITWDNVQAKLGADDIAIEFLTFPKLGTDRVQYIALTVRQGYTHPHLIELCEESELIEAAKQPYTSTALSDSIWGKLYRAGELEGVKNIYFSPCGELHKIGIESMPHWSKQGVMVNDSVEGFNIYRLSSTRELALNRTPIESTGAAVFGGIMYDITDEEKLGVRYKGHEDMYATRGSDFGDVDLRGISTDYLSASLDEVKSINSILGRKNMPVVYKTSADATEASFKALSGQGKGIIHIATHGFFLTDSAARAEKQQNNIRFLTDDAMTHSGLLFAAAAITVKYHKKVSESYEDGVLTAYEVSQLNLRGLDLVVLSACQTGNGEISGEGVFGMQRGFKMAGAQSIIMSLWNVGDEATKYMMEQFYKYYLDQNMTKREAFLKAQQDVKAKDDEYASKDSDYSKKRLIQPHWAAFILLDAME